MFLIDVNLFEDEFYLLPVEQKKGDQYKIECQSIESAKHLQEELGKVKHLHPTKDKTRFQLLRKEDNFGLEVKVLKFVG
ncbi:MULTISPECIES: hypothetical protein [Halobacteriovorax]|uniref:Uncharacterized protein n=1 Tax=Halobacteriovorax vibrionivorans TaxID=2152716 RepID=A0ABY0IFH4_9BACT|nr:MULTISPECIES: hypothetical protein [Halobacteriovorax]RZF21387.1 hypothetical protein DAY19_06795 [Halobacteriovorax vibrionivorans]TGD46409.1 hypothetical protein EP118_12225 [Halobacteriovorax sp. Y22]